jgi:hypothetical protein
MSGSLIDPRDRCLPARTRGNFPLVLRVKSENPPAREMRDLRLDEAAAVLCVSPDTLQGWQRRFGYPHLVAGASRQCRYVRRDVFALRESLEAGLSVASAIDRARALGPGEPNSEVMLSAMPALGEETSGSSTFDAPRMASDALGMVGFLLFLSQVQPGQRKRLTR